MRLFTRTSPYSVYADAESAPPDWKPGEEDAAIAFLAITLFLILDINIGIHRVFRRKQGLYYWSLIIATWACATDTIGTMLKNFKPSWGPKIWPLWTTFILCGWSLFATAELFILFSRLHLVNRNRRVQRGILIMIIVGSFLLVVPNWVMIFPAYDVNPSISSIWSPRMAIVDRTSQLGFSLMETVISAVYIASLIKILRVKSTVRQRRVMFDLIYVNLIVISVDIVVTVLTFLNQVNLAYPIQVFSYALKFKLEFVVLNQLMAVAARGLKRESFAERRYHNENETQPSTRQEKGEDEYPLNDLSGSTQGDKGKSAADNSVSKLAPFGLKSKQKKSPREAYERMNSGMHILPFLSPPLCLTYNHTIY